MPSASADCIDALALGLTGLVFGYTALPLGFRSLLGPPLWRSMLSAGARAFAISDESGWPYASSLVDYYRSHDVETIAEPKLFTVGDRLLVGNYLGALSALDRNLVDICFCLCRSGTEIALHRADAHEVWFNDSRTYLHNPNLPILFGDTVRSVINHLELGKVVLVNCVVGRSRSIAVASSVQALRTGSSYEAALDKVADQAEHPRLGSVVDFARSYHSTLASQHASEALS